MSRKIDDTLAYFQVDVAFFQDNSVRRMCAKFGAEGPMLYLYILCRAFNNGYFVVWDRELEEDAARELHCSIAKIGLVVNYMLSRSLLTAITDSGVTVLTSHDIQAHFQFAMKGKRREVVVNSALWILKKTETEGFISVRPGENKSGKNGDKSGNYTDKSGGKALNYIIRNNIKQHSISPGRLPGEATDTQEKTDEDFERFWAAYPAQYNKPEAKAAFMRADTPPIEELISAIERQKLSRKWQQDGGRYIEYPAKWLRMRGWENQVDEEMPDVKTHSAQAKDIENMKRLYDSMKGQ